MIRAMFRMRDGRLEGFSVTGHAGYAEQGRDVVCAAVSSAVQMACNGVTEVLGRKASVSAEDNAVQFALREADDEAEAFLEALLLHLNLLQEDYRDYIGITVMEVS